MIVGIKIFITLGLAVICAWMFRLGGAQSAGARYLRMLGVELTELACLITWFIFGQEYPISFFGWKIQEWQAVVSIILTTAIAWTECTYFKTKGTDAKWCNWFLCGLQYSLIPIPLAILGIIHWKGFLIRLVVLTPIITLWRLAFSSWKLGGSKAVDYSEGGAGAWQILTIPLLIIK
jgi:hypothetical protein